MSEYAWIWPLGGFALAFVGFVAGWVGRIMKGEAAMEVAKAALARAEKVERDLANFKIEAAEKFATIELVEKSENRVVDAINRLADRLDRILESPRSAPRSRATKP